MSSSAIFTTTAADGLARCGQLLSKRHGAAAAIATPAPMLYTRRGGCCFLTPDLMDKLRHEAGAQLVQLNALQYIAMPSPEVLEAYGRGAAAYGGMASWPALAVNRDPTLSEFVAAKGPNDKGVYVTLYAGGAAVTPQRYMRAVGAARPDWYVSLADEVLLGDAQHGARRLAKAVDRTTRWLDECLELHRHIAAQQQPPQTEEPQQQQQPLEQLGEQAAAVDGRGKQQQQGQQQQGQQQELPPARLLPDTEAQVFAAVVGGSSPEQRARAAEAAAQRPVAGFALCGFGMGEPPAARRALLAAALEKLPAAKPRLAGGLGGPDDVLDAVALGVDLFDCAYPTHATAAGHALAFPLRPGERDAPLEEAAEAEADASGSAAAADLGGGVLAPQQQGAADDGSGGSGGGGGGGVAAGAGADDAKLNLWALRYRRDARPLVPGCTCYACAHHSRAYVHHLLHTHELLAGVLLELHNTTRWLGFFAALRGAIAAGELGAYQRWWRARRADAQRPPEAPATPPLHPPPPPQSAAAV